MLEQIISHNDADKLARCIRGEFLPLLGGHENPADILYRALNLPVYYPELSAQVAAMTAAICKNQLADMETLYQPALSGTGGMLSVTLNDPAEIFFEDESYVFNLFLFAVYLPPNEDLFAALKAFYFSGLRTRVLTTGDGRAARQLTQALIYQQTDDSLEQHWFDMIATGDKRRARIDGSLRAQLLSAWHGILWIPPTAEDVAQGDDLNINRIKKGLVSIHDTIHDFVGDSSDNVNILRYMIVFLEDAFPSDPQYWKDVWAPQLDSLPSLVVDLIARRYPDEKNIRIPEHIHPLWDALSKEEKARVEEIIASGDQSQLTRLIQDLMLKAEGRNGFSQLEWRKNLPAIQKALEKLLPDDTGPKDYESLKERDQFYEKQEPDFQQKTIKGLDRLAALEAANKTVKAIYTLLENEETNKADKYLEQFIDTHRSKGTESEHLAKTICNAATVARDIGHFDMSVKWYKMAMQENDSDPVTHTGLAETLRELGRVDEAEALYRQSVSKFPSDAFTHTGLAETLRELGRVDEAEALYRQSVSQWPNNAVAHNGLANVLRKTGKYVEALSLLPGKVSFMGKQNCYDAHLKAMILMESGDIEAAVDIFNKALQQNDSPMQRRYFVSGLAIAHLKQGDHHAALAQASKMENTVSAKVIQLHAHAMAKDLNETHRIKEIFHKQYDTLPKKVREVFDEMEDAYCLVGPDGYCEPDPERLNRIFELEIDMSLDKAA
ncbi:MAG: tetratricopeptide repeat protein [Deltaproteobacteria bacterium]|nr:tetratricopeptide repeat protein [Deltaproteobacteria bacterium]